MQKVYSKCGCVVGILKFHFPKDWWHFQVLIAHLYIFLYEISILVLRSLKKWVPLLFISELHVIFVYSDDN